MKTKHVLLVLIFALFLNDSYAQEFWEQSYGPYGGNILCLFGNSSNVFAGTHDGLYSRPTNDNVWKKCSLTLNSIKIQCGISLSNDWIIVGSDLGGLYRSKDNGATWTQIGFYGKSVTSICCNANGKIYSTIDGSIYSSSSKGDLWSLLKSPVNTTWAEGLITLGEGVLFYREVSNTGGSGSILKSLDDGLTWKYCNAKIDNITYEVLGNILTDTQNNIYYWGRGNKYGTENYWTDLVKSTDFGITWQRFNLVNNKNKIAAVLKLDSTYFIGEDWYAYYPDMSHPGLYKSTDGIIWNRLAIGPSQAEWITSIVKNNNQIIIGLRNGGIYSSVDNGSNWTVEKINTNSFDRILPVNNIIIASEKIVDHNSSCGIFLTNDNGKNWTNTNLGRGGDYYSLVYSPKYQEVYAGISFFDSSYPQTSNPLNRSIIRGIYSSSDFGKNWSLLPSTKDFNIGSFVGFNGGLAVNKDGYIFAALYVASQTNLYRSTDRGLSWELTGLTNINMPEIIITSNNTIFIIDENNLRRRIYRSTNNGDSWDLLWELNLPIRLTSTPNGNLYAAVGGNSVYFIQSEILTSTNNGNSWEHLYYGTFEENFSKIISFDDSRIIAASLLNGILYSSNSGKTWATVNTGLPSYGVANKVVPKKYPINDLILSKDGYLYCSIDYNGIFKSTLPLSRYTSVSTKIKEGWNLVSIPLSMSNMLSSDVFPFKSSDVFSYNNGYLAVNTITLGKGYWVKSINNYDVKYSGIRTIDTTLNIKTGWNLIGSYENNLTISNLTTTPANILESNFFGYENSYFIPTSLESGKGYWIKAKQDGVINIPSAVGKTTQQVLSVIDNKWSKITISDTQGKVSTLYLSNENATTNTFELPPAPPNGIFDVRWSTGRLVATGKQNELIINSADYPITVKVEGTDLNIRDNVSGTLFNKLLRKNESYTIANKNIQSLQIETVDIPTTYELMQNYPNPFNPTTIIKYQLPLNSKVTLKIFDALGREVERLVDEFKETGSYQVEWNASKFSSGVYFYQINAGKFVKTKKLILIK